LNLATGEIGPGPEEIGGIDADGEVDFRKAFVVLLPGLSEALLATTGLAGLKCFLVLPFKFGNASIVCKSDSRNLFYF